MASTWFGFVWGCARHERGPGADGLFHRVDRMIDRAPHVRLALEPDGRCRRRLLLGQAVHPVVHDDVGHLDVLARGVVQVIAANGKRIAIAAEHEHMQVGAAQRNAAREGQCAAVDEMRAVRLHEIGEAARAADARDGRDLLVPYLALLDELEVKREHGEITAAGAPRRVIGGDFLLRETLAFRVGNRRDGRGNGADACARQRSEGNGEVVHIGKCIGGLHGK